MVKIISFAHKFLGENGHRQQLKEVKGYLITNKYHFIRFVRATKRTAWGRHKNTYFLRRPYFSLIKLFSLLFLQILICFRNFNLIYQVLVVTLIGSILIRCKCNCKKVIRYLHVVKDVQNH